MGTHAARNKCLTLGQYFLLESGLHYNWYRHYDPSLGRYLQADPLGFVDGPSIYRYARNSPGMYVDQDGRCGPLCEVAGGAVVGGGIDFLTQLWHNNGHIECVDWGQVGRSALEGAAFALGVRRTGTLWEGRYRAAPIDSEPYFLACCRYIELNPVRARMVRHPRDFRWSSYRAHAHGASDMLLADHALLRSLGATAAERHGAYRELFRAALDDAFIGALRAATNGGWALGDARFKLRIARALSRRVAPLPKGRPSKSQADKRQLNLL